MQKRVCGRVVTEPQKEHKHENSAQGREGVGESEWLFSPSGALEQE